MAEKTYGALLVIFMCNGLSWGIYKIPDLQLYALSPKGFRVELPDQPGLELFSFHGKLNAKLGASKEGDLTGEVKSAIDGKWAFENPDLELEIGDKIYYWAYVQFQGAGYIKSDELWEVTARTSSASCGEASTVASGASGAICAGKLIFEDDFKEPNIDRNKWIVQQYIPSLSDNDHYEFVSYQNKDENRFIRNSKLYLKPIAAASRADIIGQLDLSQGCTRSEELSCKYTQVGPYILPPVVSAKILSKMSFRYGKIEIKAKMPIGDWIYPQIELIPKNKLPSYPKILIAYARGNANVTLRNNFDIGNSLLFGGPVKSPEEPERSKNLLSRRMETPLGRDIRTFTLTWFPSRIELMVESERYGTIDSQKYSGLTTEYQISLGVGVGGNYDFPDNVASGNSEKPWTNFAPKNMKAFFDQKNIWISTWHGDDVALQVESVKVWAL